MMNNGELPAIAELLQYFKDTLLNGNYAIAMWNMYQQDTKTNNKLEVWHNELNRSVKKSHPNIFELITTLKAEQSATDRLIRSACLGFSPTTCTTKDQAETKEDQQPQVRT